MSNVAGPKSYWIVTVRSISVTVEVVYSVVRPTFSTSDPISGKTVALALGNEMSRAANTSSMGFMIVRLQLPANSSPTAGWSPLAVGMMSLMSL